MWFVAALGGAVMMGLTVFFMKYGTVHAPDAGDALLLGLYTSGAAAFLLLALASGAPGLGLGVVIGGLVVGAGSVSGNVFYVKALHTGPASLTAPLVNIYNVLVVGMSMLFFGEVLGPQEIIAVILLLAAVSLLSVDPDESISIRSRLWYVFVSTALVLFFLRNGGLKLTEEAGLNNTVVLFLAYTLGILWFGAALWRDRARRDDGRSMRLSLGAGLLAGLCSFGGMQLYAFALVDGPASIVSPIFSTNGLVAALLMMAFFKERLSRLQLIALAGIVVGLILVRV